MLVKRAYHCPEGINSRPEAHAPKLRCQTSLQSLVIIFANLKWLRKARFTLYHAHPVPTPLLAKLEGALNDCAPTSTRFTALREMRPITAFAGRVQRGHQRRVYKYWSIMRAVMFRRLIVYVVLCELQYATSTWPVPARAERARPGGVDPSYRPYIERIARHLASANLDAEEVIIPFTIELTAARGQWVRQSKFADLTGARTLRGGS